jgi:hypothetical protein
MVVEEREEERKAAMERVKIRRYPHHTFRVVGEVVEKTVVAKHEPILASSAQAGDGDVMIVDKALLSVAGNTLSTNAHDKLERNHEMIEAFVQVHASEQMWIQEHFALHRRSALEVKAAKL